MTSLTLSVPDEMDTPKRLSVYGAVTVARTCEPAVQVPTALIVTFNPGTLGQATAGTEYVHPTEFVAANFPSLTAVVSDGASPLVVGAPESAAARAPERAASEMSM